MHQVLDVCRYIIHYSNDKGYGISNLKLQKLLYFLQALFLVRFSKCCFEERIEAWDFGPVIPIAYREYKIFGGCDIPSMSYLNSPIHNPRGGTIRAEHKAVIAAVVDKIADYSATDLTAVTYKQSPWKDAYVPHRNREIIPIAIQTYFAHL